MLRTAALWSIAAFAVGGALLPGHDGLAAARRLRWDAHLHKEAVIRGEPPILVLTYKNTTDTALRLSNPAAVLRVTVHGVQGTDDPRPGRGGGPIAGSFTIAAHSNMTYYQNLWAYAELEEAGTYVVRVRASFGVLPLPAGAAPGESPVAMSGESGPLRFEVVEPPREEQAVYRMMAGSWGQVWCERGTPPDLSLLDLAERIEAENPHSAFLPYVLWRTLQWYQPFAGVPEVNVEDLAELSRSFRERFPDFPTVDEPRLVEVLLGVRAAAEESSSEKMRMATEALRELAMQTPDVAVQMAAIAYAELVRREYLSAEPRE